MRKLLILMHHAESTYRFRRELIEWFSNNGYEVHLCVPDHETIKDRMPGGIIYHDVNLDRHGMNPFADHKLYLFYCSLIKNVKPDCLFSFTIKPNIYGSMAAAKYSIPIIPNITGLGSMFSNKTSIVFTVVKTLYKLAFKKVPVVFFQNQEGKEQFLKFHLIKEEQANVIPGSGVNISHFIPLPKTEESNGLRFLFIARIMKEKGIEHFLYSAEKIRNDFPKTEYHIAGMIEETEYKEKLEILERKGIIKYLGDLIDIREEVRNADCIVLPSYYPEGMSNVLLEGAAMEKPLITTTISGCRETVEDGVTGLLCTPNNPESLYNAMHHFLLLSKEERDAMGKAGRRKIISQFDRMIVIEHYIKAINKLVG